MKNKNIIYILFILVFILILLLFFNSKNSKIKDDEIISEGQLYTKINEEEYYKAGLKKTLLKINKKETLNGQDIEILLKNKKDKELKYFLQKNNVFYDLIETGKVKKVANLSKDENTYELSIIIHINNFSYLKGKLSKFIIDNNIEMYNILENKDINISQNVINFDYIKNKITYNLILNSKENNILLKIKKEINKLNNIEIELLDPVGKKYTFNVYSN